MSDQPDSREPSGRPGADRSGQGRDDASRAGNGKAGSPWPRPGTPGTDLFGDLQRWFIRQSAKSMRRELSGQVRRTLGGGKPEPTDVWDTATNEIPPEVGESPECQWCPVCRAARRMRDAGPGLGGQLSGAGDAVASAVQDAIGVLDSLLARTGGSREERERPASPTRSASTSATGEPGAGSGQDSWSSTGSPAAAGGLGDSAAGDAAVREPGASQADSDEADPWQAASTESAGTGPGGTESAGQADKASDPAQPAEPTDGRGDGTDDRS